jgi:hypothetical protein
MCAALVLFITGVVMAVQRSRWTAWASKIVLQDALDVPSPRGAGWDAARGKWREPSPVAPTVREEPTRHGWVLMLAAGLLFFSVFPTGYAADHSRISDDSCPTASPRLDRDQPSAGHGSDDSA